MAEMFNSKELSRLDLMSPQDTQWLEAGAIRVRFTSRSISWCPPTDIFETEESVVVRVEIAGMREEDFTIELDGKILVIRGNRPDIPERRAYHQMEIRFGEFSCEVELSVPVDSGRVEAVYRNGFLRVLLPKERPSQIQVKPVEIDNEW